jgi:hypothetical protein
MLTLTKGLRFLKPHAKFGGVWVNNEGGIVKYTGFRQSQINI